MPPSRHAALDKFELAACPVESAEHPVDAVTGIAEDLVQVPTEPRAKDS
jgi:hypothetical protein